MAQNVPSSTPISQVERRERYPTAGDWSSNVGSEGRKASTPSQMEPHVEQVTMDNASEGTMRRRYD